MPDPHIVQEPPPACTGSKPYPEQCVTPNIPLHSLCHPLCRPRSQYPADSPSNGSIASTTERASPHRGLPSDPRPAHKIPSGLRPGSGSSVDTRSPSPGAGHNRSDSFQYHIPVPDTSSSAGSYSQPWNSPSAGRNYTNGPQTPGGALQKKASIRPPGAAEPRVPGHASTPDSRDDPLSPMSATSGSYFPREATYSPSFSNIPPPPPLKPSVHAQTPARPKDTLARDSSDDILAPGSHGFARPLSNSKFLIIFSGIFRNKTVVLCLQCPAASGCCDPPALSRLQARA